MKEVMSMGNQNYIQKNGDLIVQVLPRLIAGQAIYDDPTSIFNWDIQTKKNDLTVKDKSEVEKLRPLQKKIIRLLAIGLCSNEIGNVLNYETSSIEKYRGNILKEYDLKNSFQLSSWAFSNELVTTSFMFQANQKVVDENSLQPDELSLLMTLKKHLNTKKNL
jgi:DNA-binding NarL/FixJ family response regulator